MDYNLEVLIRFGLAILWGGLVGAEREYRGKSAGFRTTILISFGSCFFTLMSELIGTPGNPDRIASNIVTGIGFLGAGVIFRGQNQVNGITTAASIWAVAAVGMGIGAGYYFTAACASLMILFVLAVLPYLEKGIDFYNQSKIFTAKGNISDNMIEKCEVLMQQHQLKSKIVKQIRENNELTVSWQIQGKSKNLDTFIYIALLAPFINRFEC